MFINSNGFSYSWCWYYTTGNFSHETQENSRLHNNICIPLFQGVSCSIVVLTLPIQSFYVLAESSILVKFTSWPLEITGNKQSIPELQYYSESPSWKVPDRIFSSLPRSWLEQSKERKKERKQTSIPRFTSPTISRQQSEPTWTASGWSHCCLADSSTTPSPCQRSVRNRVQVL